MIEEVCDSGIYKRAKKLLSTESLAVHSIKGNAAPNKFDYDTTPGSSRRK